MRGPRPHQLTMKNNRVNSQRPNPTDSDQTRTGKRTTQKQPTTVTRASGHPSQHASNQHASGRAGQRADRHASGQRQKQTHASIKQAETKLFSAVHMHISPVSSCWYKTKTTTSFLLPQQNHSPVFISHSLRHHPYHPTTNLHSRISSKNFFHSAQSHFSTRAHTPQETKSCARCHRVQQ